MRYLLNIITILLLTTCGSPIEPSVNQPTTTAFTAVTAEQSSNVLPSPTGEFVQTEVPTLVVTQQHTNTSPTVTEDRVYTSSDIDLVETLEERVARTPIIIIGRVTEAKEIINTSRDVNDDSKPDPQLFALGQVYGVEVERYLKGDGPTTVNVIQSESATIYNDDGPPDIPSTPEEVAQLKAEYPHIPLRANTRYLFFLISMPGFDPALNYLVGGGLGEPWRFVLPEGGQAQAESAEPEALPYFPPRPSAELLDQVEQLIETQK